MKDILTKCTYVDTKGKTPLFQDYTFIIIVFELYYKKDLFRNLKSFLPFLLTVSVIMRTIYCHT